MFIPDHGSEFFPPGSQSKKQRIPEPDQQQRIDTKLLEIWSGMFPNPKSGFFSIPAPRGQKGPDPGSGSATLVFPVRTTMEANLEGHDARVWQAVYNGGQLVHILWRIAEGMFIVNYFNG